MAWGFFRLLRRTRFFGPLNRLALGARFIAAGRLAKRRRLAARRLDAAECAPKFVNLAFVGELLARGDFDEFEHFVELVNHLFERLGDFGGVRDGLTYGGGFSRTKIGGLDPRFWAQWFGTTLGVTLTRQFALRCWKIFSGSLRDRRYGRIRFVRGKICGRFSVRLAKIAGRIGLGFDVFGRRSDWFGCFRRRRNFFGTGRAGLGNYRARTATTTAATTATTTAAGTRRGRFQIGVFVRHKF